MMNVMEKDIHEHQTHYEILVLQAGENFDKIKKTLGKHGATVLNEKPVQKMKLAYPIQKQTMCFAQTIEFMLKPEDVAAVKAEFGLDEELFRVVLNRVEKKEAPRPATEEKAPGPRRFFGRIRKVADAVLTNEALEKKIEEISQ